MQKPLMIRNSIIPFKGFAAINICGILFLRKNESISDSLINHELIHTCQIKEMLYIGFYLAYIFYWIKGLLYNNFNSRKAYFGIPFEKEAYANQHNMDYISSRTRYQWRQYI